MVHKFTNRQYNAGYYCQINECYLSGYTHFVGADPRVCPEYNSINVFQWIKGEHMGSPLEYELYFKD